MVVSSRNSFPVVLRTTHFIRFIPKLSTPRQQKAHEALVSLGAHWDRNAAPGMHQPVVPECVRAERLLAGADMCGAINYRSARYTYIEDIWVLKDIQEYLHAYLYLYTCLGVKHWIQLRNILTYAYINRYRCWHKYLLTLIDVLEEPANAKWKLQCAQNAKQLKRELIIGIHMPSQAEHETSLKKDTLYTWPPQGYIYKRPTYICRNTKNQKSRSKTQKKKLRLRNLYLTTKILFTTRIV